MVDEQPKFEVRLTDQARRQMMDIVAEHPEVMEDFEEVIKQLQTDPKGPGTELWCTVCQAWIDYPEHLTHEHPAEG